MALPITYDYFGGSPVTVMFQSSTAFNGNAVADKTAGVITPGAVAFPVQAGPARIDFHTRPLQIQAIATSNVGNGAKASIVHASGTEVSIADLVDNGTVKTNSVLPVGAYLKITSTGGTGTRIAAVTATEVIPGAGTL